MSTVASHKLRRSSNRRRKAASVRAEQAEREGDDLCSKLHQYEIELDRLNAELCRATTRIVGLTFAATVLRGENTILRGTVKKLRENKNSPATAPAQSRPDFDNEEDLHRWYQSHKAQCVPLHLRIPPLPRHIVLTDPAATY